MKASFESKRQRSSDEFPAPPTSVAIWFSSFSRGVPSTKPVFLIFFASEKSIPPAPFLRRTQGKLFAPHPAPFPHRHVRRRPWHGCGPVPGTPPQCRGTPPMHHLRACARSCPSPKAGWDYALPLAADIPRTGRRGPTPSRPSTTDPLALPPARRSPFPSPQHLGIEPSSAHQTRRRIRRAGLGHLPHIRPTPHPREAGSRIPTRVATPRQLAQQPTAMRPPRFFLTLTPRRAHFCSPKPGPTRAEPSLYTPYTSPEFTLSSEHFRVLLRRRGAGAPWMSLVTNAVHAPPLASCAPAPRPLNAPSPAFAEKLEAECPRQDSRAIEVLVNGLQGAQVAVDATLVSPVGRDGLPRRRADTHPATVQEAARRQRTQTYPEFYLPMMLIRSGGVGLRLQNRRERGKNKKQRTKMHFVSDYYVV